MNKFIFIFLFFLLGIFNNIGYVLIWTSSSDMSSSLEQPNLVAVYLLVNQVLGLFSRFIATKFLLKINYHLKVLIISIILSIGYILFFIILTITDHNDKDSLQKGFYLTLIPTGLIGMGTSVGELNLVGYFKKYPSDWLSGFYGGTGVAGILGASVSIIFSVTHTKPSYMWLIMSICALFYYLSYVLCEYFWKKEHISTLNIDLTNDSLISNENKDDSLKTKILISEEVKSGEERNINNEENLTMTKENMILVYYKAKWYIFNIGMTYFLGYLIVHMMNRYEYFKYIDYDNQYMYYNLSYQVGVFISRSSVKLVKHIKSQWILTGIQSINCIFWLLFVKFGWIESFTCIILLSILVGLICGGSYVYGYYLLYEDRTISKNLRELCLSVAFTMSEIFLILNSVLCVVLDNTLYK